MQTIELECGDSYRIQTCNLLIRSQMLYSVELRSRSYAAFLRLFLVCECKGTVFLRESPRFRLKIDFFIVVFLKNAIGGLQTVLF